MSLVDELKSAVTPRAALLVVGVFALQMLFIASYVGALHDPKPRDVPFGVVAPQPVAGPLVERLEKLPDDPLDPRTVASADAARDQILNRDIDGALIVDPAGRTDTLLVASGGGTVLSSTLQKMFTTLEGAQGRAVRTVDVAPASPKDFDGLSAFYLVVGWCVGGYICAAILAISAGSRPANLERAVIRLGTLAVYSVLGGLGGAIIVGPILGALPGSVAALWGLGALVVFAVGAATLALQSVFGIVGIGLAILLIVVAGNPSAGGAFPLPMLPPFWNAIGPALPPGAGTWVARSIAYFKGNDVLGSLLILSSWALVGSVVTLVMSSLKRKPGAEPIAAEVGEVRP
ncbi:membrane protein [Streptomyces showdoensis]|uniref:Membrane protein n=1 Tax=Streptomyces showdoensis TaxID=68268 RepID=A0A2P2GJY3_STREW|nr:membrane protein [Streptomyces showdoensis]KKZ71822.1 membrane protein [Streptomyces showdoensis]